jgi:hypothetical protein
MNTAVKNVKQHDDLHLSVNEESNSVTVVIVLPDHQLILFKARFQEEYYRQKSLLHHVAVYCRSR